MTSNEKSLGNYTAISIDYMSSLLTTCVASVQWTSNRPMSRSVPFHLLLIKPSPSLNRRGWSNRHMVIVDVVREAAAVSQGRKWDGSSGKSRTAYHQGKTI